MSPDLDRLLEDAVPDRGTRLDVDGLWAAGRRRRAWRRVGQVTAGVVAVLAVGSVAVTLAGGQPPALEPLTPPTEDVRDLEETPQTPPEDPVPSPLPTEPDPRMTAPSIPEPAEPDPAAMDDPCAPHAGREAEAFIDVVSPVNGQQVDGPVELVGCSNVYEANVLYRVLDAAGDVVVEGFTTATCGSGCVGEFREQIHLDAVGELTLEVFWEDAADGSERDVVTVVFTRG